MFTSRKSPWENLIKPEKELDYHQRVTIGSDVWIGGGCYIRDGITIGNGCVIGSGSVIVKDVPAYSIAGGVPAKVIRSRFGESIISTLQSLKWWDLDHSQLKQLSAFFAEKLDETNLKKFVDAVNDLREAQQ